MCLYLWTEIVTRKYVPRGPYKGIKLDKMTNAGKKKLAVEIGPEQHVAPVGETARLLSRHLGHCVRSSVGSPHLTWEEVMQKFGNGIWAMITVNNF